MFAYVFFISRNGKILCYSGSEIACRFHRSSLGNKTPAWCGFHIDRWTDAYNSYFPTVIFMDARLSDSSLSSNSFLLSARKIR